MDSKIIFIDFEGPSIAKEEGRDEEEEVRMGCVSQGQYNSSRPQLFVLVHALTTHSVPLIFIYITAWMGEQRTERKGVRVRFSIKELVLQQMLALSGFGRPEIFGTGADDVNVGGLI